MLTHTEKKLFHLILSDDLELFKERFVNSDSYNKFCINQDGVPLLGFAVQSESPQILEFLCSDSELRNFKGPKGTPAVHYVVEHMNPDVIDVLKSHDFDFNELDRFDKNVLHVAARVCEHKDFVALIKLGADVNQQSLRGETPKDTLQRWGNNKVKIRENSQEFNH